MLCQIVGRRAHLLISEEVDFAVNFARRYKQTEMSLVPARKAFSFRVDRGHPMCSEIMKHMLSAR